MLALAIHLAAAIRGYMAYYMPTNRAVDWLRTPRGLKWAIPVALVATPAYLFAMSICVVTIERGGPGYLNVLVMLFAWNALKFTIMAPLSLLGLIRAWTSERLRRCATQSVGMKRVRPQDVSWDHAAPTPFLSHQGTGMRTVSGRRKSGRWYARGCPS